MMIMKKNFFIIKLLGILEYINRLYSIKFCRILTKFERCGNRVYKNYCSGKSKLPNQLFQIVLANSLADGSLYTTKTKGSKLKLEYGRIHKDYLLYLHKKYKGWILPLYEQNLYVPNFTRGTYKLGVPKSYMFRTIADPAFDFFYDMFMVKGKKSYKTGVITEFLTDVGFSYWVLDDGSLQTNNAIVLSTHNYTHQENKIIAKELSLKFNLRCSVIPDGKYYCIYISANDLPKVRKLLKTIPPIMLYKVPVLKTGANY